MLENQNLMLNVIAIILFLLIVAVAAYFIFRSTKTYYERSHQVNQLTLQQQRIQPTIHLRLQAYERLTMLAERISIPNLIGRLRTEGMSVSDLRLAMLIGIQQEFEHNVTQQIYVSENLWNILALTRNNTADILTVVADKLDPKADASVLVNELLTFLGEQGSDPSAKAQAAVRQEAAMLL